MILHDAYQLLTQSGQQAETLVLAKIGPGTMSVLQVEPEDTIDVMLVVLRQHTGPVIVVLPASGSAFDHPDHFAQLRCLQDTGRSGEVVGFVIPGNRLGALARHAHQQGFFFSSSLEKVLQSGVQRVDHRTRSTEDLTKKRVQAMEDLTHYTTGYQPETGEREKDTISQNGHTFTQASSQATEPPYAQGPYTPLPETLLPPSQRTVPTRKRPRGNGKRLVLIAALISILVLVSATVLTVLFVGQPAIPTNSKSGPAVSITQVGTISFTSSGQLDPTSSQGLNDQISLSLSHLAPPAPGHADYAWLLPDKTDDEIKPLLLGTLDTHTGTAHLNYTSPDHANLLTTFSRFRVTEQESGTVPVTPSLDPSTWRYVGEVPSTPTPGDEKGYSLLSHLRHLLAKDPTLQSIGLNGGLDIWLYRNAGKLIEYTTATRDDWSSKGTADLMHRQIVRILDYLYGSAYAWQQVPPGTPFLIDAKAGRLGLLEVSPNQNPPGYLAHVDIHLQGLANSPGHTAGQRQLAIQIDHALNDVTNSMRNISKDAVQLVKMSTAELQQQHALDLINDMVTNANTAYVGQPDPATGENTGGVIFIHNKLQGLATMPITTPSKGDQ
jgi:hypothetical protein